MSDTPQENLSVEDILSSIKNILVDENGTSIAQPTETVAAATIPAEPMVQPTVEPFAPQPTESPKEDVFELDSSMIVTGQESTVSPATQPQPTTVSTIPEIEIPTPSAEESIAIDQALNMVNNIDLSVTPEINIEPEPIAAPATTIAEPVIAPADPYAAEPLTLNNPVAPEPEITQQASKVQEETIDASASIINNFAKVFAEKQQEQTAAEQKQEEENVVDEVKAKLSGIDINNTVKETIVHEVSAGLDNTIAQIAPTIVTSLTQKWLNENLAAIVEKTVAQEINRVIAKVGS